MKFYHYQTFFEQQNVFYFFNKNQNPLAVVNILTATEDLEYYSLGTNGSSLANEGQTPSILLGKSTVKGKKKETELPHT